MDEYPPFEDLINSTECQFMWAICHNVNLRNGNVKSESDVKVHFQPTGLNSVSRLRKAKKYDWKDSNLALFGSDTEKQVKIMDLKKVNKLKKI
ncbi:hypothetical protein KUTeg_020196 [Tegillarca granosa]|uniref:Uncharacterized protein n=1 Tax=Tegillarca granosa TaxID=220873 RepID=A0ABQ9E781_TEGGR|nr:hypothetical protein KUTeg_020196 [Tegillarca granosa]